MSSKPDSKIDRLNLGFLLAKATQRWNEQLTAKFAAAGFPEIRASYGSLLVPLFEENGLRLGELARRSRLSKQAMTTMIRLLEREELVERRGDPEDARASRVYLTAKARRFRAVAEEAISLLEAEAASVAGAKERELVRAWLKRFSEF
jgi:DNA-binding MarR family transcriptional regulator